MENKPKSLQVGDSFILRDDQIGAHLHVIVAQTNQENHGQVMLVYVTDSQSYKDHTTILNPGDHPFINKVSWVKYQNILICQRSSLENRIVRHHEPVSDELLKRIQDGILKSKLASKENKALFREWRLNHLFDQLD